jgi:UDPglucose 6-dehydrogenase
MKQQFGIVGYGIVGKATHKSLLKDKEVLIHDINHGSSLEDLKHCNTVFFCIPTSSTEDLDKLEEEIKSIKVINPDCIVVIRSTVPVFFCKYIESLIDESIYYIPEFLRERVWEQDCEKRPLIVGLNSTVVPMFLAGQDCLYCSYQEAEIIKLFSNNMASARVVFANHFYDISQRVGADYSKVVEYYKHVEHNDQNYIDVNEKLRGFGGKCLPKDLDFLIQTMQALGLDQTYFSAMKQDNKKWPTTVKKS